MDYKTAAALFLKAPKYIKRCTKPNNLHPTKYNYFALTVSSVSAAIVASDDNDPSVLR